MNQFDKDMASPHRQLFLTIRDHLLSAWNLNEVQKPRITTFSNVDAGICHMRTMPSGVDLGFLKGAKMTDDFGKLSGNGKVMRVLSVTEFDKAMLDYYLSQATRLIR